MNRATSSIIDFLTATACAVIAAVGVIPFSVIAFVSFAVVALQKTRSRIKSGHARYAFASLVASVLVFGGLLSAAATYRPSKIVEQLLFREIRLPSERMTLADLSYTASLDRHVFPIRISLCFADADKETVVEWPRRDLTLGEFLDAIESQTVLRRRFMHCGNGYTVLYGGDCCFGLYIRDPALASPPFPRERFDVDAYAASRDLQNKR